MDDILFQNQNCLFTFGVLELVSLNHKFFNPGTGALGMTYPGRVFEVKFPYFHLIKVCRNI